MPPSTPPTPYLPSSVFDALHALDYDSTAESFKDTSGNKYYFFAEKPSSGSYWEVQWNYDTDTSGVTNPRGNVSQGTFDVVKYGTYNSQDQTISYGGKTYRIRLVRVASTNKLYGEADLI